MTRTRRNHIRTRHAPAVQCSGTDGGLEKSAGVILLIQEVIDPKTGSLDEEMREQFYLIYPYRSKDRRDEKYYCSPPNQASKPCYMWTIPNFIPT